jgi:hypothetical protein
MELIGHFIVIGFKLGLIAFACIAIYGLIT